MLGMGIRVSDDIDNQFWELCDLAQKEDEKEIGITPRFGDLLLDILCFVKSHPESRDVFIKNFIYLGLNSDKYTEWILLFCMRDLRYPEVRDAINEKFHDLGGCEGAPRLMNFVSDVNNAYDELIWEDADIFEYHWAKEHPGAPWPLEPKNA